MFSLGSLYIGMEVDDEELDSEQVGDEDRKGCDWLTSSLPSGKNIESEAIHYYVYVRVSNDYRTSVVLAYLKEGLPFA